MSASAPAVPSLQSLLRRCLERGASDLHLSPGQHPRLRLQGELMPDEALPALEPPALEALAREALGPVRHERFQAERAADLALTLEPEGVRFRLNVFATQGRTALAIRRLDDAPRTLEELRLPRALLRLAELEDGLVLVSGPTGSGKTTTLALLIDKINAERSEHVITLEDPIEYLHPSRRALVHQRQLHEDFAEFADALRSALREDPDVLLVGEMRDLETMRTALVAAETGHLVLSTLHASSAVGAIERLVGAFPGQERDSVRHQTALVLRAALSQRLFAGRDGRRTAVVELLWATPAVANLIRAGKSEQLTAAMEAEASEGTLSGEQSLAEAVAKGWLEEGLARRAARQPRSFDDRLRRLRAAPREAAWR